MSAPLPPSCRPLPPPRDPGRPYRVCCVCLGNICRSPMAEVVLRDQLDRAGLANWVVVDSAGTGGWHAGDPMERRARAELARRGFPGGGHRGRQFDPAWLAERDLILAMDAANLRDLRDLADLRNQARDVGRERIRLFGEVAGLDGVDVPDPYYGSAAGFTRVLTLLEEGMARLTVQLGQVTGKITGEAAGGSA